MRNGLKCTQMTRSRAMDYLTPEMQRRSNREISRWNKEHPTLADLYPEVYKGRKFHSRSEQFTEDYILYGRVALTFRYPLGPRKTREELKALKEQRKTDRRRARER